MSSTMDLRIVVKANKQNSIPMSYTFHSDNNKVNLIGA